MEGKIFFLVLDREALVSLEASPDRRAQRAPVLFSFLSYHAISWNQFITGFEPILNRSRTAVCLKETVVRICVCIKGGTVRVGVDLEKSF
jgi:hypothetical protein